MAAFLDKVVGGLNKGVNAVSEGSKYILEKNQINSRIQSAEKEKTSVATDIGNVVYKLYIDGKLEVAECVELFDKITALNHSIDALNNNLKEIEEQMIKNTHTPATYIDGIRCSCGNINKSDARFCTGCGKMLERESEENRE